MSHARIAPHRWRRILRVGCLGLAGLLVAVIVLALSPDRTAAAGRGADLVSAYESARMSGLRWAPALPVAEDRMRSVVWRFEARRPAHWPFSGPLPPPPAQDEPAPTPDVNLPDGLSALGTVIAVVHDPGSDSVISFRFDATGRAVPFVPGEIIRAERGAPARFRLRGVQSRGEGVYHVLYDVLDGGRVVSTETLVVDGSDDGMPADGPLHRPGPTAPDDEDSEGREQAEAPVTDAPTPAVLRTALPELEALRPIRHVSKRNKRQRVVEFDRATYDWSRGRGTAALTEIVKTSVAKDASGGVLGLRITGMAKGVRADAFDVHPGDILVSIEDRPVRSREDAIAIARTLDPNSEKLVKIVIDRNARRITYRIDARDPRNKRKIPYFRWED